MAHSTPDPNFSLRSLFSLGHATSARYFPLDGLAASFLACCVQVTSIGENRPREKRLTSTYLPIYLATHPPTYPPAYLSTTTMRSHFVSSAVDKPYRFTPTSLFTAPGLTGSFPQVPPYIPA